MIGQKGGLGKIQDSQLISIKNVYIYKTIL